MEKEEETFERTIFEIDGVENGKIYDDIEEILEINEEEDIFENEEEACDAIEEEVNFIIFRANEAKEDIEEMKKEEVNFGEKEPRIWKLLVEIAELYMETECFRRGDRFEFEIEYE